MSLIQKYSFFSVRYYQYLYVVSLVITKQCVIDDFGIMIQDLNSFYAYILLCQCVAEFATHNVCYTGIAMSCYVAIYLLYSVLVTNSLVFRTLSTVLIVSEAYLIPKLQSQLCYSYILITYAHFISDISYYSWCCPSVCVCDCYYFLYIM